MLAKCSASVAGLRGRYSHLNITPALGPSPSPCRAVSGIGLVLLTGWSLSFRPKPNDIKALAMPRRDCGNKKFHNMPYATCKSQ